MAAAAMQRSWRALATGSSTSQVSARAAIRTQQALLSTCSAIAKRTCAMPTRSHGVLSVSMRSAQGQSAVLSKASPSTGAKRQYASAPEPFDSRAERAKDKQAVGPFNAKAAGLFIVTGIGLFFYFKSEKAKVEERKRLESSQAKVGRPKIGGPFDLLMPTPVRDASDMGKVEGRKVTDEDLKGTFTLIYFGFTNCPDICPEELDKMSEIVKSVDAKHGPVINPVFITCDPARDTLGATALYVSEFHPRLVGLTGSYNDIKDACKQYRVYFSTPPGVDASSDYLVDHSIFFYLMDPEGKFIDAFGRSVNAQEATTKVMGYVDQWVAAGNTIQKADLKERVSADVSRRV